MKKLALFSATAVLCVAGQAAFAHTGVRSQAVEGVAGFNDFTITHGCNGNISLGDHQDVIAMSALFPNAADPALAKVYQLNSKGIQVEELPDLSNHIQGVLPGVGFTNLGVGLVAGNNTLFGNFLPILDTDTLVGAHPAPLIRGYHTWAGPEPYNTPVLPERVASLTGLSPFRYGAVKFQITSCAKSLKVRIAVANWCKRGKKTAADDDRVDLWIGHTTAVFNDQRTMPRDTPYDPSKEVPFWPTLTINRDLVNNPLNPKCGAGYDLAIEPADADIDALLPPPRGKYPNAVPGPRFFPTLK